MSEPATYSTRDDGRAARIGRAVDEFLSRRAAGEPADEAELLARHPDLAGDLRLHLGLVRDLRPAGDQIADLVKRGVLQPAAGPGRLADLGPYRVLGWIGRGGMGIVLKGLDLALGRVVAIKVLRPDLAGDRTALTRFAREAKAAAALNHPNIVAVYGVGGVPDGPDAGAVLPYIVMEYVDGPSLSAWIRAHGPLPAVMTREVFRQLLAALAAAHDGGLVHRDVKSSNVLLQGAVSPQPSALDRQRSCQGSAVSSVAAAEPLRDEDQPPLQCLSQRRASSPDCRLAVKLADFGLARMRGAQTQVTVDGSILGTPEYMSPEQARGDSDIDHRTDLYSAGVVLYEMLTGVTPFKAETPTATLRRILDEEPRDPRKLGGGVDPVLASIALRLLAKRREERLGSAGEALQAICDRRCVAVHARGGWRITAVVAVATLAVGALWASRGGGWLIGVLTGGPDGGAITRAECDPAGDRPVVWACDRTGGRHVLHEFPAAAGSVPAVGVVDVDGRGRRVIVAGVLHPLRVGEEDRNLFAFDAQGREVWSLALGCDWVWSGAAPPAYWSCHMLLPADLDGRPGDELIAVAKDFLWYPNRISIVDAGRGVVLADSTIWHAGDIKGVTAEADYFGRGQAALLVRAVNNKLDEVDATTREWPGPSASYDFVPAIMILDPRRMNGVAPPQSWAPAAIPLTGVEAYAFLDVPSSRQSVRRTGSGLAPISLAEVADIGAVQPSHVRETRTLHPWKSLLVLGVEGECRLEIVIDRELNFLTAVIGGKETLQTDEQYWRQRWHLIIQQGRYVDE